MSIVEPKTLTLHMIGNAHLDPVWLWDWREGRQEALDTCRAAVDRLCENDDFVFTRSSAAVYHWIEKCDPDLFEQIRDYVARGRWEIVGGWWVQPDCNLPSGESFVRHALYGKQYFRRHFGVDVQVGYNVDSFGHNVGLPQILRKTGYKYYTFCRPDPNEKFLPALLFEWESPDGSRVLAYRPPLHYEADGHNLGKKIFAGVYLATAQAKGQPPLRDIALMYGVGNHGGGPTIENIEIIKRADANPQMPRVKFARLDEFFDKVAEQAQDLPVVVDDLQYHSRGCYTSNSRVKWYNRTCEMRLMTAERWATLLHRAGILEDEPLSLEPAWRKVLFNQFHDIMGGCSIERAYEDVYRWYEEALDEADSSLQSALQVLTAQVATEGIGQPWLVTNPLPWPRREAVRPVADRPSQIVDVPALGWTVLDTQATPPAPASPVSVTPCSLENEYLSVTFGTGGLITSLIDKRIGQELITGAGHQLVIVDDQGDAWGHGITGWRDDLGVFEGGDGKVIEDGPARGALHFALQWGRSTADVTASLVAGRPRLDFHLVVDWHERHRMLKVSFPLAVADPEASFEQSYAAISLPPDGSERHAQRWVDVTGTRNGTVCGVALLNDCKYGFDVLDSELRMTITRSSIYSGHGRPLDKSVHHRYLDQGEIKVNYALLPHVGRWQDAGVARAGWEFNNPVHATPVRGPTTEKLPALASLAEVGPENVIGTVFKRAEDGSGVIARLYETAGQKTEAWLSLPEEGAGWKFDLAPYEIKTFRLPAPEAPQQLVETDLLEQPLSRIIHEEL